MRERASGSTRRRTRVGLVRITGVAGGLLALLIGLAFAVLLWSIVSMRESVADAKRSQASLTQATKVERFVLDLETGQRGYVITRQSQFLEPWDTARAQFPRQAQVLVRMSSTPGQQRLAQQIAQEGRSLIDDYSIPLVDKARRGDPSAQSVAATQEGKRRVDALRKLFDRYETVEGKLAQRRGNITDADAQEAVEAASMGLTGSVILILAFATYVTRAIVWPVRRAASLAARLADGDLTARMPETGAGEIGELEAAFNSMGSSLENSREKTRQAHNRLKLLYESSLAVGTTLDVEATARALVRVAVPRFADFATVDLADSVLHGMESATGTVREMRRVAVGGIRDDAPLYPLGATIKATSLATVWPYTQGFASGGGAIATDLRSSTEWRSHDPERAWRIVEYGIHSLITVPLHSSTMLIGAVNFWRAQGSRPFAQDELSDASELAAKAAVAIENARLYEQVRSSAEQFQRLLLPRLPDLHPYTAAAVYRPATAPGHLGGDWYDALLLPDGACAVVIGDVVGHDLYAAAAMSQTRNMLRALLYDLHTTPSAVLAQLDSTLGAITDNPVTTACLARVEPAGEAWSMRWSNAGHPPPLLLTPGSSPMYLHGDPGVPLCVDTSQPRPDHVHPLRPDTTVIFFTDGLVEHPRHSLDVGLAALATTAAAHADQPLPHLLQTLADSHPSDGHDDMAVLALRTPSRARGGAPRGSFCCAMR